MNYELFIIPVAYVLDFLFGDPHIAWHPVRLIGRLIEELEKRLNKREHNGKVFGVMLVILVTTAVVLVIWGILKLTMMINQFLFYGVSILLIYFALSARSLVDEAGKIKKDLDNGDIRHARNDLSMIVGRDTNNLDEPEIIRATVETVAESTMDGVIAPLFYVFLGGPVLVWVYKTVNTLDSMVGHKNERFKEFGWASAKLDGLLNLIPAKITAFLISVAMIFCGKHWLNAIRWSAKYIFKGPGFNGDTAEASMAGGLGVRLGGTNYYDSVKVQKPFLGDAFEPLAIKHICQSNMIAYIASTLMLVFGILIVGSGI